VSGEEVAPSGFSAPGLPFPGFPVFPVSPHVRRLATAFAGSSPTRRTFLSQARAPLQGFEPRVHRRRAAGRSIGSRRLAVQASEADNPPGLPFPFSACGARDPLTAGSARHPPRSGLSVSHALAGLRSLVPLRACCIPVTLLGFKDLQGLAPPGRSGPLSRPSPLVPLIAPPRRCDSAPEVSSRRESVPRANRSSTGAVPLMVFSPLGHSVLPHRVRLPGLILSCASTSAAVRRRATGASEFHRAEDPAFPESAGPSGVRHLVARAHLSARIRVSVTG